MPGLYEHLSGLGVPVHSFTTKWLMCIFADTAPTETVLRIWDFLFTDGSHVLFLLVYSLFKTHQVPSPGPALFSRTADVARGGAAWR